MSRKKLTVSWLIAGITALVLFACQSNDSFYANLLRSEVFYQTYDEAKYDFLWVFDNSGSMAPRRDYVRDNMGRFLQILNSRKAVNYQMAVTTTDQFSFNGALVSPVTGPTVIKSIQSTDPAGEFAGIMNNIQDTVTSFWEQGLESAYQAMYQHGSEFSRTGIPLVVIILTDEDDWSCSDQCFGDPPEINTTWVPFPTTRYIDYFSNVKKSEDSDSYIFPIVGIDSAECSVPSIGSRYKEVQEAVAGIGVSGSICASKLQASFEGIAQTIADRGSVFKLSESASDRGISVYVNQRLIPYSPDNYIYDAENRQIIFTGAIPKKGDLIEVTYARPRE